MGMGCMVRTEVVDGVTGVTEMMQETWTNNEITTLLEGLNKATKDMVPRRHYMNVLKSLASVQTTIERLREGVRNKALYDEASMVLDVLEGILNDTGVGVLGEMITIEERTKLNAEMIMKNYKWRKK